MNARPETVPPSPGFRLVCVAAALAVGLAWTHGSAWSAPAIPAGYDPGAGRGEIFEQANAFYRDGDPAKALDGYLYLADLGIENGQLYYNLGNAYFRLGETGKAVLWYERALRYLPRFRDLKFNLEYVRNTLVDEEFRPEPPGGTLGFLAGLHNALNPRESLLLLAAALWLLGAVLAARMLIPLEWMRSALKAPAWTLAVLAALGVFSTGYKIYRLEFVREAVVMSPALNVATGPGGEFSTAFTLHEGTKVEVVQRDGDWVRIVLPGAAGFTGWAPAAGVETI